jgi:hypothetical protein
VCEAEVWVKVVPLDVVLLVERTFGHGAFFVEGYGYFEFFASDGRYLFDSAGVCFFF